jgi:hypothetical protein
MADVEADEEPKGAADAEVVAGLKGVDVAKAGEEGALANSSAFI